MEIPCTSEYDKDIELNTGCICGSPYIPGMCRYAVCVASRQRGEDRRWTLNRVKKKRKKKKRKGETKKKALEDDLAKCIRGGKKTQEMSVFAVMGYVLNETDVASEALVFMLLANGGIKKLQLPTI